MKTGDLVELSAYGRNLKNFYNSRDDDVAIILSEGQYQETFTILWCSDGYKNRGVSRKDIKYAKKI